VNSLAQELMALEVSTFEVEEIADLATAMASGIVLEDGWCSCSTSCSSCCSCSCSTSSTCSTSCS